MMRYLVAAYRRYVVEGFSTYIVIFARHAEQVYIHVHVYTYCSLPYMEIIVIMYITDYILVDVMSVHCTYIYIYIYIYIYNIHNISSVHECMHCTSDTIGSWIYIIYSPIAPIPPLPLILLIKYLLNLAPKQLYIVAIVMMRYLVAAYRRYVVEGFSTYIVIFARRNTCIHTVHVYC